MAQPLPEEIPIPDWHRRILDERLARDKEKPEEAIPLLAASTSVDQDGSIHFQLFRAYQLTKNTAEAQKALAQYQRLRSRLSANH